MFTRRRRARMRPTRFATPTTKRNIITPAPPPGARRAAHSRRSPPFRHAEMISSSIHPTTIMRKAHSNALQLTPRHRLSHHRIDPLPRSALYTPLRTVQYPPGTVRTHSDRTYGYAYHVHVPLLAPRPASSAP